MDMIYEPKPEKHLHNSDVVTFLSEHKENPNIKKFLEQMQEEIVAELNEEFGTEYQNYIHYLNESSGDDASYTIKDLIAIKKGK